MAEWTTANTKHFDDEHSKSGKPFYTPPDRQSETDLYGFVWYPDGAYRENHPVYCQLREPPRDPLGNAQARLRYHEVLLSHAENRFLDSKQALEQRVANGDIATPQALEGLKAMAAEAKQMKKNRDKVQREIDKITAPEREAEERAQAFDAQRNAQRVAQREAIKNINI